MVNNSDYNSIDDEAITFLHQFPTLKGLSLLENKITGKGVKILSEGNFPYLEGLELGNEVDNIGGNGIGDEEIIFLHQFPNLKDLGLGKTNLTGKGMQILSEG